MRKKQILLFTALLLVFCVHPAAADTILKFGLSETGGDMSFESGTLFTKNDGIAATPGDQNTGLNFTVSRPKIS